jgi:hypothetical protein
MKKIIVFVSIVFLLSCERFEVAETPVIELGATSSSANILSINTDGNKATVMAKTTPGAKYSLQLFKFGVLDPIETRGFTAIMDTTRMILEFKTIPSGIYDISLTDISGNTDKKPIILK